jgi:hypothetical protein
MLLRIRDGADCALTFNNMEKRHAVCSLPEYWL